jgi:hypothetical protein|tara:strand:- start:10161 stop:10427 length:267 start_codon:yes stop_codon:yes gene_type:complete
MWKYPQVLKENNMDSVEQVSAELATHEAVCAERWKTIFNKIHSIEKDSNGRFNGIETLINRIETILIGCAGFLLITLAGIVVSMLTIH